MTRLAPVVPTPPSAKDLDLLPFRFHRLDRERVLLTNMVGEHVVIAAADLEALVERRAPTADTLTKLRARHIVRARDEQLPLDLLAMKALTRHRRLAEFTGLHIFVVTLRCDHACTYCQVSRQNSTDHRFDMSEETADLALDMAFRSPSRALKFEFQGGEPLLNFPLIERLVRNAEARNEIEGRSLEFVIATNLAMVDDHIIEFARAHGIHFSTSLDGPPDIHNRNRPRPGRDSWTRTLEGLRRVQQELGHDRVNALMTTSAASLGRVREIIDCYVASGLTNIFLRPISPYGFAVRTGSHTAYNVEAWLRFYEEGLDHILELNSASVPVVEQLARIVLRKMLTNDDAGYVDLMSPAGIGLGALVYNYDGDVYASDEGRMLAEMGDTTFRLGNLVQDSYGEIVTSDALLDPLDRSIALSAPMCSDCAFEPWCGADPVFHHTTMGDALGRKAESAFCQRNMGVFSILLDRYENDPHARRLFDYWANR